MTAILKDDPPPLMPASAPAAIDLLLTRCLEKSREARMQSARDMAFALEFMAGTSATRAPAGAAARARWWLPVAAVLIAVGALAMALSAWPFDSGVVAPSFPRVMRLTHTTASEHGAAISPDGKWVAYLSDARGPIDIWVKFLAGGEASNLTATTGLDLERRFVGSRRSRGICAYAD